MFGSSSARIGIFLSLLLIILLAVLFFVFVDMQEVAWQLRKADPYDLAIAGVMLLGGFFIYSLRWQRLLQRQTSLASAFHATSLGNLVNMMLPMNPGDAVRVWLVNRSSAVGVGQATSSVVIEKLFENILRLVAFSGMLVIGMGFFTSSTSILAGLIGFLGIALTILIWMVKQRSRVLNSWPRFFGRFPRLSQDKVHQTLAETLDAIAAMSSSRQLVQAGFSSILTWLLFFGFHYFVLQSLNFPLTQQQMLALSLGTLMMIPPSAPTLPGVFHAQVVLPFAALGISSSYLTAYAILLHAVETGSILLLGVLALLASGASAGDLLSRRALAENPAAVNPATGD